MSIIHGDSADLQTEESRRQDPNGQPVASLLECYRSRRAAWIAEAESLAQLRDQVRSAADQETVEIVARARRDVRDVIAIARRELLVLTEQLRAALGDSEPPPRALEALNQGSWLSAPPEDETLRDIHATVSRAAGDPVGSTAPAMHSSPDESKPVDDWGAKFNSLVSEARNNSLTQW